MSGSSGIFTQYKAEDSSIFNDTFKPSKTCENKSSLEQVSGYLYTVQAVVSTFIVIENSIVLLAILNNWYNLTRQHNIYRYLISLVVADLLYGISLLLHSSLTFVYYVLEDSSVLIDAAFKDATNNLVSGVLHGSCFASLASASLLNLVLRTTCNRALARAAAIDFHKTAKLPWLKMPSLRNLGTTRVLIGFIWTLVLVFIFAPLRMHCHQKLIMCKSVDHKNITQFQFAGDDSDYDHIGIRNEDCSLLRSPISRTYLMILNCCIAVSWFLMVTCNVMVVCTKTSVVKTMHKGSDNVVRLSLQHSLGFTWDSSSLLICIITVSMTVSTVPYVVFTFLTEAGSISDRMYYAEKVQPDQMMLVQMTTYISSLLNPFIYMAMLTRLRGDVSRMLEAICKKIFRCGQTVTSSRNNKMDEITIMMDSYKQPSVSEERRRPLTPSLTVNKKFEDKNLLIGNPPVTSC